MRKLESALQAIKSFVELLNLHNFGSFNRNELSAIFLADHKFYENTISCFYQISANYAPFHEVRVRRSPQGPPPPLPIAKAQTGGQRLRKQKPKFESDEVFRAPTFAEDRADLPTAGSSYAPKSYKKGKVGPVYTFVKTDYDANFKWGVRHVAGKQHGR